MKPSRRKTFDLADQVATAKRGAVIALPRGRHVLSRPLVVATTVTIRGSGTIVGSKGRAVVIVQRGAKLTLLRATVERTGKAIGSVIACDGELVLQRVTVSGGSCTKRGATLGGVLVDGAARARISDCRLAQSGHVAGVVAGGRSRVTVERSRFHGGHAAILVKQDARGTLTGNTADRTAIGLAFIDRASGTARNNRLSNNQNAISVGGSSTPRIERSTCVRPGMIGIAIMGKARPQLTGNRVSKAAHDGLGVFDRAAPTITRNTFEHSKYSGMYFAQRSAGTIVGNVVAHSGRHGIALEDRTRPTLRGNECHGNKWSGIGISGTSTPVVDGNRCHDNRQRGIVAFGKSAAKLSKNVLAGNAWAGLSISDHARVTSARDRCEDNGRNGIELLDRARGAFTNTQLLDNDGYGLDLQDTASVRISNAVASDNERAGIHAWFDTRIVIERCRCERNGEDGIEFGNDVVAEVRGCTCHRNDNSGIRCWGPVKVKLFDNACNHNDHRGIALDEDIDDKAPRATLRDNTTKGNGSEDGIGTRVTVREAAPKLAGGPAETLLRAAYIPTLEAADGALTDSKLGGTPYLRPGEVHPTCTNCNLAMPLFLQLDCKKLPAPVRGSGLVQLFYCTNKDAQCSDFETHLLRRISARKSPATKPPVKFPPKRIVGWREHAEVIRWIVLADGPRKRLATACARAGFGYHDGDETVGSGPDLSPELGDKLAGWPCFIQEPSTLRCSRCRSVMRLLFQIDSEHGVPWMWGDSGVAFIFQCETHQDELDLEWQCF